MKRFLAYLMTFMMLLSLLAGLQLSAVADPATSITKFSSSFESTDPALNVDLGESSGVSGIGTKSISLDGEFTNYASTNPVTVNRTLTYGSESENENALIDRSTGTKLCAVSFTAASMLPLEFTFNFAAPVTPTTYYVSGANDDMEHQNRVISSWNLLGSTDGETWNILNSQTAVNWTSNFEMKMFTFENTTAYQYYKLAVTGKGNAGSTNETVLQFSGFGLGTGVRESGVDGPVESLWPKVATGPAYNWGSTLTNRGWTGASSLLVSGTKTATNAKSYTTIYEDLDIEVVPTTKLSYMIFPDVNANYTANVYDFEYTSMYAAIDLEFSDGTVTRLKDSNVIDQYGNVVSPIAQGDANVQCTNNWLKITANLASDPRLLGKHISKILVGFEKNGGTPGKEVRTYFDDIKIYEEADPVVENLADYVDILRGTYTAGNNPARGLNAAIVATPYPFNFWAPATESTAQTPYLYGGSSAGFRHIKISHVASNWIPESGTFQISADSFATTTNATTSSAANTAVNGRISNFKHENEIAKPYYYGVTFDDNDARAPGVKVEVTPTEHAAILRFTFPAGTTRCNVLLDSNNTSNNNSGLTYTSGKAFTGFSQMVNNGQKRMHISGEFDVEPTSCVRVTNNAKTIFKFAPNTDDTKPTVVELKMATSFMTVAQAEKNLGLEIEDGEDFEDIKAKALKLWNDSLKVVEIEGATYDQSVSFYSNLYRNMVYPTFLGENTGTKAEPKLQYTSPYSGSANAPVIKDGYLFYNHGFWDTFRTTWPMLSILTPKNSEYLLNGIVNHYVDQNWVPRWIAPGGTNSMVGTNSDNMFGDALNRGVTFDVPNAYASALKNASVYSVNNASNSYSGRSGIERSVFLGYFPAVTTSDENLSWSLEGYVADFGISEMAKIMRDGKSPGSAEWRKLNDEYLYFQNRAKKYNTVFNPAVGGWFRGKKADGTWLQSDEEFNPDPFGYGYCEDNAWNYAFHATHDGIGLANLYGGPAALGAKLDTAFSANGTVDVGTWSGHKENWEGRECKLGMVHLSNEPACAIPYMYLFSDTPWKTQEVVRDIMDRLFIGSDVGQGYIGDDDNGAMSAWYCLSALGLYPISVGNGVTALGTPLFKKATINRDDGKKIVINAPNVSRTNKYVQGVTVGGVAQTKSYIAPEVLKNISSTLEINFDMGPAPSTTFGVGKDNMPPSLTTDEYAPSSMSDLTTPVTPSATDLPSGSADGAYTNATNPANLFNNTSANYASFAAGSKFATYYFAKGAVIDMYTITSSTAATAPTAWILSGSNDGETWKTLDTRTAQTFDWDRYTRPFAVTPDPEESNRFNYFRIEFTNADEAIRVSQLELLGGEFAMATKDVLRSTIDNALLTDENLYAASTYEALTEKILAGEEVWGNDEASVREISDAITAIEQAIEALIKIKPANVPFEAVTFNASSFGIKKEATTGAEGVLTGTVSNIGGVTPGSHVGYDYVDFGNGQFTWKNAAITYSGKAADLSNSRVLVHLDALDGPVIADLLLDPTGTEWNVFETVSGALTQNDLTGYHSVYYEFRGNGASVANINSFVFESAPTQNLGKLIAEFSADSLTAKLKYFNDSNTSETLRLVTAIYTDNNQMKYSNDELHTVEASNVYDFNVTIDVTGIMDEALQNGYSVGIYLWDGITLVPVMEKYFETANNTVIQRELDLAKEAIEAGVYNIPATLTTQTDKTAWVQEKVTSYIPAGNATVATVTFEADNYVVKLANDSIAGTADITVNQDVTVTFMAPDANDGGYREVVTAESTGLVILPTAPVRTGYRFIGWYKKQADGDFRFTANTVVTSNDIVYAKWIIAPDSATSATIVFDDPMVNNNLTMNAYDGGEKAARVAQFHGDTVASVDTANGKYFYALLPNTFPALRNARNVAFDITYYDIGTVSDVMFETANGTDNFANRHFFPMTNTGELVTHTIYATDVRMNRGTNGGDFRIRGTSTGLHIKSIVIREATQPTLESIERPTIAPQTEVNNLIGKTLTGYQLWFTSSPTNSGWVHWSRGTRPTTYGQITFENYPDVREYPAAALNNSGLPNLANGSPSQLFTSKRKDVVDLHLDWIDQYGMDGVAVQRFASEVITAPTPTRNHVNLVQDAVERTNKTFYVMYDFSGISSVGAAIVDRIKRDWVYSIEQKGIVSSPNYAHAEDKPVVCLWGLSGVVSQSDGNTYIQKEYAMQIINWFKERGYYIIGGTPDNDWYKRVEATHPYAEVYANLDMISPWYTGRYGRNLNDIVPWLDAHVPGEMAYCEAKGMEFQPVMFAGFNWSSFQPYPPNEIPRAAGEMLWTQAKYFKNKGIKTAYFAMFDEYDEGTALMKTAEDSSMLPLATKPYFQTLSADGTWLSSDFYLRLAGTVTDLLKNSDTSIASNTPVPIVHAVGPVYWRNGFERRHQEPNSGGYAGGYNNVDVCLYKPAALETTGVTNTTNALTAGPLNENGSPVAIQNGSNGTAFSFDFKGTSASDTSKYHYKIAETTIVIPENLQLSYWIKASNDLGKSAYVNLQLDDGSLISQKVGFVQKKANATGIWEQVTIDLDPSLVGKTIKAVVASYENGGTGDFVANIDDIAIQVKQ